MSLNVYINSLCKFWLYWGESSCTVSLFTLIKVSSLRFLIFNNNLLVLNTLYFRENYGSVKMPTKRVACEKTCRRLSCYRPQTTPHGWQEKQSKPWVGHSGLLQHGQRRWKCRRGCRRYVTAAICAVHAWTTAFALWRRYSQHFGWVVSILFKQIFRSGSVGGPAR